MDFKEKIKEAAEDVKEGLEKGRSRRRRGSRNTTSYRMMRTGSPKRLLVCIRALGEQLAVRILERSMLCGAQGPKQAQDRSLI